MDYTISTDTNEELALDYILAKVNANRAGENPPKAPITKLQLLDGIIRDRLVSAWRERRTDEADRVRVAYDSANQATQDAIKSALGVS